jgi:hypothetical protein
MNDLLYIIIGIFILIFLYYLYERYNIYGIIVAPQSGTAPGPGSVSLGSARGIALATFFPPVGHQRDTFTCQSYSMIYYIGTYYHMLQSVGLMDDAGNISFDNLNITQKYNEKANAITSFYSNPDNILNPLYNYIRSNGSCADSVDVRVNKVAGNVCGIINLQFYDIHKSDGYGTYSELDYTLTPTRAGDNISGCDLAAFSSLKPTDKINPFKLKSATVIYSGDSESNVFICVIGPTINILNYGIEQINTNRNNILNKMIEFLNKGVPIRIDINLTPTIVGPNTFYGVFSGQKTTAESAIISQNSFSGTFTPTTVGHALTIVGYANSETDSNVGRFGVVNSWGTQSGLSGYGYITYDYFFKTSNDGGMVARIIAFQ